MKREKMVTRTVTLTNAEYMGINVETAEVIRNSYMVAGLFTDEQLLKVLKKELETETIKIVHIESQQAEEILFGMPESEFIAHAEVLPPRNQ